MFYLFINDPLAKIPVRYTRADTPQKLNIELKKAANALFVFNTDADEITIISDYYSSLECSYFIFKLLGIFKPQSTLTVLYPNRRR